jgi:hypothetical protein
MSLEDVSINRMDDILPMEPSPRNKVKRANDSKDASFLGTPPQAELDFWVREVQEL